MGEAKAKKTHGRKAEFDKLDARLRSIGINTDDFGFYDSLPFLNAERADPSFLEQYARWVALKPRTEAYDQRVRSIVPRLTENLARMLLRDDLQGGCITSAGMMSRMLDRLGVWSYGVIGCLTLEVASKGLWRGMATVDDQDFPGAILGHAWVVAPPFVVIDAAVRLQRWHGDAMGEWVPDSVLIESGFRTVKPDVSDVVSAEKRGRYARKEGYSDPNLHYRLEPRLREFGKTFPSIDMHLGELRVRYVPVAARATDVPLEQINSEGRVGRSGAEMWAELEPMF